MYNAAPLLLSKVYQKRSARRDQRRKLRDNLGLDHDYKMARTVYEQRTMQCKWTSYAS